MQIRSVVSSSADVEADALVVTLFQVADGEKPDAQSSDLVEELYSRGEFTGKALETAVIHRPASLKVGRLLLIGGGARSDYSAQVARDAAAVAVRQLQTKGAKKVVFTIPTGFDNASLAQATSEGAILAGFDEIGRAHV